MPSFWRLGGCLKGWIPPCSLQRLQLREAESCQFHEVCLTGPQFAARSCPIVHTFLITPSEAFDCSSKPLRDPTDFQTHPPQSSICCVILDNLHLLFKVVSLLNGPLREKGFLLAHRLPGQRSHSSWTVRSLVTSHLQSGSGEWRKLLLTSFSFNSVQAPSPWDGPAHS